MDLSVIVCCYKGEETIEKCLDSLCNQSYNKKNYEVVIIDDDSIDNSTEQIKTFIDGRENGFPKIKYFKKLNEGLSVARNFGIENSSSELISFIDEDAKADKNFVKNVIKSFKINHEINCLGGRVELWNEHDYFAKIYHYGYFNAMMTGEAIIGTNMSFRKSFLEKIGGFNPKFNKRGDESALFLKAGKRLSKNVSPDVIVYHTQPNSEKTFFMIRHLNGSLAYECEKLSLSFGSSYLIVYLRSLYHISFIILPILILISFFINYMFSFVLLILFSLIFVVRFLVLGHLLKPLRFLHNSNIKKSFKDYIYLSWLIIYGFFQEDLGHVKMQFSSK